MNSQQIDVPGAGQSATPVSDFVRQVRQQLERSIPLGWISGEVSSLTRAASGHLYFTLKDSEAQLRCAMWRNRAQLMAFQLREGMQVEVRAQITVYEPRGDLQLTIDSVRQAGLGNLFEAFMRLKARLEAEGLFDAGLKRHLPRLPRRVALVTSPQAAALHDVLTTLARRAPGMQVALYPARVQGEGAAIEIAAAIGSASRRAALDGCEALIVCRGGGSLDDLWAFNDELVVRAIRACALPVISGVGHETDVTLCDFAADLRAATPTAAAEQVSSAWLALRNALPELARMLTRAVTRQCQQETQRLDLLDHRLVHPRKRLDGDASRLAQLALRMARGLTSQQHRVATELTTIGTRLLRTMPRVDNYRSRVEAAARALEHASDWQMREHSQRLTRLGAALQHLDPAKVMQRGYAVVRNEAGQIVPDATRLHAGNQISIQFAKGSARAVIREIDT